ncbi:hypothetical protein [Bacillus thuringiensis]
MTKKSSQFKLGNAIYGSLKVEEVFLQDLELYFIRKKEEKSPV